MRLAGTPRADDEMVLVCLRPDFRFQVVEEPIEERKPIFAACDAFKANGVFPLGVV